jgi:predicted GNAT family N-acyltransferase
VSVEIREPRDEDELRAALKLREDVFVGEQGVPLSVEVDDRDPQATHLVAVQDGRVVATTRLLEGGDALLLGRLAVVPEARRRGLATGLLEEAERLARARGKRRILLNAQTYACALYETAGYVRRGSVFREAGIEHVRMELTVA